MPIFNPGSGPVPEATEAQADLNMRAFVSDLARLHDFQVTAYTRAADRDYGNGRWAYDILTRGGLSIEIQMPGASLRQVQEEWFRLYVNGSSWFWEFALRQCVAGA